MAGPLERQRPRQVQHPRLRGAGVRDEGCGAPGVVGDDVHDAGVASLAQQRMARARDAEGAVEHDVDDRAPGIFAHLGHRRKEVPGGIVDQYVERTPFRFERGGERRHALAIAHINDVRQRFRAGSFGDGGRARREMLVVARRYCHLRAVRRKGGGERQSHPGAAARHEHARAGEQAVTEGGITHAGPVEGSRLTGGQI